MNARRTLAATTAAIGLLLLSLPASAAIVTFSFAGSDFYVPRPVAASDQEGVYRLLTTFDLAANGYADLIGTECNFVVSAANGDSVHLANFGAIVTGGNETDVYDTESEPNVETTRLEDADLVLGDTIELYNIMIADPNGTIGTSVDYIVTVTCDTTPETTTTTEAPTTTTTEPPTTTTTVPPVPTTVPITTTTTEPETTTTSVAATSTSTVPPVSGSTLPFTGPPVEAAGLAMVAASLLMLGGGVVTSIRERNQA